MDMMKYLGSSGRRGGNEGILTRIANNMQAEEEREKKGMAMAEATQKLFEAKTPRERVDVYADYARQGYNFNDLRDFNKPDTSGIKSVQGGLYDVNSGKWVVPPKGDKASYGHLIKTDGGLYNANTGQMEVEGAPKKPNYGVNADFGSNVEDDVAYRLGVDLEDEANQIDPELMRKLESSAAGHYSDRGNFPQAVDNAMREHGVSTDTFGEIDREGHWNPFVTDKNTFGKKPVETEQNSSVTRTGAGRGSGMVVVSNGSETLRIDPADLQQAQAEGFEVMY